jgi:6-phosphogluconolactonase
VKPPEVFVHRDATLLAQAAAARLVTRLVDAQSGGAVPHLVLTGGRSGGALLAEIAASPARDAVDWARVEVWWGDERYLPAGDPERNETQARAALLDRVGVDEGRVHPMPASDAGHASAEDAAAAYAELLRRAAQPQDRVGVPAFDVVLLGLGEDGHIASVFPESPALHDERTVAAVRGAPKPPPTRITMTLRALGQAREVWLLASGAGKARAAVLALSAAGAYQIPAAGARGRSRTLMLLDQAAAARLPKGLDRRASS